MFPLISSSEKKHLLCLLLFALSLRLYVFLTTPVIGTDGYNWFHAARCFAEGDFVAGLRHPIHPGYPILFAGMTELIGNYEVAGKLVSLILGVLTIFPLYFLTRSMFGHYAGISASFLLAINPTHVRLSADIMADPTNLFFFLSAIWMGWEAIKKGSWQWYALAGVCVVLSYFTRAEGLALFVVTLPWLILANIGELRGHLLKRAVHIGLFIAPVILLSISYLLLIHKESGIWHVTRQGAGLLATGHITATPGLSEEGRTELEKGERVPEAVKIARWKEKGHYHMIFLLTLNEFAKDFYQPLLPLLLIGFFKFTRDPLKAESFSKRLIQRLFSMRLRLASSDSRAEFFLLSFFGLYFLLYYLLAYNAYYISGRYVLPMAVLSFVWAGVGVEKVVQYLRQFITVQEHASGKSALADFSPAQKDTPGFDRAVLLLLVAVLGVALPKDLKIKRKDEVVKKEAGYWIKAHSPVKNPVIMGLGRVDLEKVAFYAEGEFRHLSPRDYKSLQGYVKEWSPSYLVLYREKLPVEVFSTITKSKKFVLIREWNSKCEGKDSHFQVYRVRGDSEEPNSGP